MAQPVSLQFRETNAGLPDTYVLPADMELELASVKARIDGAAASGIFIPCLTILSQDGKQMARVRIDQEFAVADTGDCTWAPFLRRATSVHTFHDIESVRWSGAPIAIIANNALTDLRTFYNSGVQEGTTQKLSFDAGTRSIAVHTFCHIVVTMWVKWGANFAGVRYLQLEHNNAAGNELNPTDAGILRSSEAAGGQYDLLTLTVQAVVTTNPMLLIPKVFQLSGAGQALGGALGIRATAFEPTIS